MPKLSALEIRRQLFHLVLGIIIFFFVQSFDKVIVSQTLGLVALVGLLLSLLSMEFKVPIISWFLRNFDRPEDQNKFPGKGAFYLMVGSFLVVSLFSREVAGASILILAVGDSVAHLIGASFGKRKTPLSKHKTLEGTISGLIAATAITSFIVGFIPALIASAAAMLVEMVDFERFQINDNILVPFISALVLSLF